MLLFWKKRCTVKIFIAISHKKTRVQQNSYNAVFDPKKRRLRAKNTPNFNNFSLITNTYQGQTLKIIPWKKTHSLTKQPCKKSIK